MRKASTVEKILLWLYVLPLAFDFRGDAGGTMFQYALAGITAAAGFCFVSISAISPARLKYTGLNWLVAMWWMFLIGSLLVASLNSVPLGQYLRVVFPFLLCGLSILVVQQAARRGLHPSEILLPLLLSCAISLGWIAVYQVFIRDSELGSARYGLVSTVFPLIVGYAMTSLLTRSGISFPMVLLSVAVVAIVSIALTRGAAISLVAIILGVFLIRSSYARIASAIAPGKLVATISVLIGGGIIVASLANPAVFARWYQRTAEETTREGTQVTLLTRVAEYSGQLRSWSVTPSTILVGRGIGSTYEWDWGFAGRVASYLPKRGGDPTTHWFAGHGIFVYSLYSSGLLLGWVLPWVFLVALWRSYRMARSPLSIGSPSLRTLAPFPFLALAGFVPISLVANPFWLRLSGLAIGLLFALPWWLGAPAGTRESRSHSD
jgi:hypothetical protein